MSAAGCDRNDKDLSEIRDQQRKILVALADLEQKIDRIASRPATAAARAAGPTRARTYNLPVEGSPVKGPADAPITIVEFADYQCPFCARSEGADHTRRSQAYPTQARFVYKHFPLTVEPSAGAARGARRRGGAEAGEVLGDARDPVRQPARAVARADRAVRAARSASTWPASKPTSIRTRSRRRSRPTAASRAAPACAARRPSSSTARLLQNRTLDGFRALIDPMLSRTRSAGRGPGNDPAAPPGRMRQGNRPLGAEAL